MEIDNNYYIAITGCSGSGKSTALKLISRKKFFVVDFDRFSLKVISENFQVQRKLEAIIGEKIFTYGKIDFKKVGAFFETNLDAEKDFEVWYQLVLGKEIKKFLATISDKIVFADVPFLAQKNISNLFKEIWIVESTFENCFQRLKARNNYSADKIIYLIERSKVAEEVYTSSSRIINNNGTLEEFGDKINHILNFMKVE